MTIRDDYDDAWASFGGTSAASIINNSWVHTHLR